MDKKEIKIINDITEKLLKLLDVEGDFEIIVRDISGKKIVKEISLGKINEGKKDIELNLSDLTTGFYLVELKTNEGSVYSKLLIQK